MDGEVALQSPPSVAGIHSDIRSVAINIDGELMKPAVSISVADSAGNTRGRGSVDLSDAKEDGGWIIQHTLKLLPNFRLLTENCLENCL